MRLYPMALVKLLMPTVMIGLAYWARAYIDQLGSESRVILDNLPYLICVVALFLAYQFNRCRHMLVSFGVAAFYWTVQNHLQVSLSQPEAARLYLGASLAVPLLGLFLLLVPERGIWNLYGLISSLAFVFLGLVCVQFGSWLPTTGEGTANYYAARPTEGYVLSFGATLLIGLTA